MKDQYKFNDKFFIKLFLVSNAYIIKLKFQFFTTNYLNFIKMLNIVGNVVINIVYKSLF